METAGGFSGNGWVPVMERVCAGIETKCRGDGRFPGGTPFGARVAFFPLRAAADTYSARAFEGHKLFQQVFGKSKILPTSPAVRVEKNNVKRAPDTLPDTHCFSSSSRYKMLFRLCLIAIITPTRKQRV